MFDDFDLTSSADESSQLDTTSMVDVIFILLAFFVVVSQLKESNLNLSLPETKGGQNSASQQKLTRIQIDSKNKIYFNKKEMTQSQLEAQLAHLAETPRGKSQPIQLRSDKESKNGIFINVLDLLKRRGFSNIQISVIKK